MNYITWLSCLTVEPRGSPSFRLCLTLSGYQSRTACLWHKLHLIPNLLSEEKEHDTWISCCNLKFPQYHIYTYSHLNLWVDTRKEAESASIQLVQSRFLKSFFIQGILQLNRHIFSILENLMLQKKRTYICRVLKFKQLKTWKHWNFWINF